jgi:hypothetical protein
MEQWLYVTMEVADHDVRNFRVIHRTSKEFNTIYQEYYTLDWIKYATVQQDYNKENGYQMDNKGECLEYPLDTYSGFNVNDHEETEWSNSALYNGQVKLMNETLF